MLNNWPEHFGVVRALWRWVYAMKIQCHRSMSLAHGHCAETFFLYREKLEFFNYIHESSSEHKSINFDILATNFNGAHHFGQANFLSIGNSNKSFTNILLQCGRFIFTNFRTNIVVMSANDDNW